MSRKICRGKIDFGERVDKKFKIWLYTLKSTVGVLYIIYSKFLLFLYIYCIDIFQEGLYNYINPLIQLYRNALNEIFVNISESC